MITINVEKDGGIATLYVENFAPSMIKFQVARIYEDGMDPKVARIMKGMKFFTRIGLGKYANVLGTFLEIKG